MILSFGYRGRYWGIGLCLNKEIRVWCIGIRHTLVVTQSERTVGETIRGLDVQSMGYTDFVMISGDGIFSQVVNA